MNEIELRVAAVLAEVLGFGDADEPIGSDTDLIDELGLDSLQAITFLLRIEDEFDIELDYDGLVLDQLRSVRVFSTMVVEAGVRAR
jgi:acyl carrier protein